ncbi:MAG: alpha/beta fold hydrolase [Acidimicrobiales bacterium]
MVTPSLAGADPFSAKGGPIGVLVVHGFTGSPQSMRPLALAFAEAGYSVELPLLPGHGTSLEDMIPRRWSDWSETAEAAYAELAGRSECVFVAGLSMGGSLAIWLAERHPDIAGLVVVNPLVDPPAPSFRDVLKAMLASGATSLPGIGSDIALEGAVESGYNGSPIEAMLSMFDAVEEMAPRLGEVTCPVLLISSRNDHVVPTASGDLLQSRVAGPLERVWLERSFHVATLDYDAAEVEERAVGFVEKVAQAR